VPNGTVFPVVRCRFDIARQAAASRHLMETMQTRLDGATDPRVASFWLHLLCSLKPLLRLRLCGAIRHLAGVAADAAPCGHQAPGGDITRVSSGYGRQPALHRRRMPSRTASQSGSPAVPLGGRLGHPAHRGRGYRSTLTAPARRTARRGGSPNSSRRCPATSSNGGKRRCGTLSIHQRSQASIRERGNHEP
jgi:hypothetical protein